jgi:hypothetical protein
MNAYFPERPVQEIDVAIRPIGYGHAYTPTAKAPHHLLGLLIKAL